MSAPNGPTGALTPEGLTTCLMGYKLEHPFMFGAGPAKSLEDVRSLAMTQTTMLIVGSIHEDPPDELNLDRPVFDLEYYGYNIPQMRELAAEEGNKPLGVSIGGFSPDGYSKAAKLALEAGASFIEINCAFRIFNGRELVYKHPADPDTVARIVSRVKEDLPDDYPVGGKLHPSMPHDIGKTLLGLGVNLNYWAGVGLDQVRSLSEVIALSSSPTQIVGVESGPDPYDSLRYLQDDGCNVAAVQMVGSYFRNPGVIGDLLSRLTG